MTDSIDAFDVVGFWATIVGYLVVAILILVLCVVLLFGALSMANMMASTASITEASTSGVVESVELEDASDGNFAVSISEDFDPGGTASLYIVGPDGMYGEQTLVGGYDTVLVPEDVLITPPESGEYTVVVADSGETYGEATVTVARQTPVDRLSGYISTLASYYPEWAMSWYVAAAGAAWLLGIGALYVRIDGGGSE